MDKDLIFIEQHKKAIGEDKAKKMLSDLKKSHKTEEKPQKVYISVYGGEVHVNGPVVSPVAKPETLAEKIARFERLAEVVRANRSLLAEVAQTWLADDDDSDVMADKEMAEVDSVDEFGEHFTVTSQPKISFAEPKDSTSTGSGTNDVGGQPSIEADEASQKADPAQQPDMQSQE